MSLAGALRGRWRGARPRRPALRLAACIALAAGCGSADPPQSGADAECRADVLASFGLIERNYAGYRDKVERLGAQAIEQARQRALAELSGDGEDPCRSAFVAWLSVFADRHITVKLRPRRADSGPGPAPAPAVSEDPDPGAPSFEILSENAALIRAPSFDLDYQQPLAALVAEHRADLARRSDLIIDVRGNRGGGDAAYDPLAELVYSQPVAAVGADVLASAENIARWEQLRLAAPESVQRELADLIERMKAKPGEFVVLAPDGPIERSTLHPYPLRVAVLVDGACASSCEQFLLEARASRKVRLAGSASAGILDYANVVHHVLPSGLRLGIPTSRSRRLPGQPVDGIGVQPDLEIDPALFDGATRQEALGRVLAELAAGTGSGQSGASPASP
jgi:hypothetical protein